jgi:NAD(P)-dependent dehydrogenase (short-subunit alcohol dehydrogenase family)
MLSGRLVEADRAVPGARESVIEGTADVASFQDRVAVVTGASRGIGLGIARELVARGAQVCLTARSAEPLAEAVRELGGPKHAIAVAGKADDPAHQQEAVAAALAAFGRLDMLVNNAGINPVFGSILDVEPGAAAKILAVNVLAPLAWTRLARDAWMGEHGGSVVNVASVAGVRASLGIGMYGVSKAALIRLTMELAAELGPGIRVNAVAPAVVKTRFASALYEGHEEEAAAPYPLKRLGVPEDVAGAAAFLLSDEAGWITGQTLVIDGGITLGGGL